MTLPWRASFVHAGAVVPDAPPRRPDWIQFTIAGQSRQIPAGAARQAAAEFRQIASSGTPHGDTALAIAAELRAMADQIDIFERTKR